MDTIVLPTIKFKKLANAITLSMIICFLSGQNLFLSANDSTISAYTGITPTIKSFIMEDERDLQVFDSKIKQKYFGGEINDIEKGIKHIKLVRYYNNRPVRLNIVELSTKINKDLNIEPSTASQTLASKSKISKIAEQHNAIVAINAGYFKPQTGVPLGTLMINKKIYTGPIYNRVAIGFFENKYEMSRLQCEIYIKTNKGGLKIDNINQPRMLSTHAIVYTSNWGEISPPTPKYGKQIAISNGRLSAVSYDSLTIPKDGFVVVGSEKNINSIIDSKSYKLDIKINPDWKGVNHIISGGPYLIKNGEIYIDTAAQKLNSITGRNPRTAIGYTKENNLIMVTADGREGSSVGLTLYELASLMKEFGCINAMNLDGGGSTVMYIQGKIVNKPAIQGGIPLSHTLTITHKDYS